jgi:predicted  nucleic acid-binding Zn-ribbon protein
MTDKATRKRLKKIRKEIKTLKKTYQKIELRPCKNDEELKQKDMDLKGIMERIYELEKEQDRFFLNSGRSFFNRE